MRPSRGALVAVLVVTAGCGPPPPPKRGALQGTVTLDGKPVAKANIRFIALEETGVNVLARVADGKYDVPAGQGPTKGKYRVEFSVPSTKTRRIQNPDNPLEWLEEPQETLPARYHRDSQYLLDYDPDDPKPYNAELKSQ